MNKLFTATDSVGSSFTLEQYHHFFNNSIVVSNESIRDFLAKIQDVLASTFNSALFTYNDKAVDEVMSVRYQTLAKAKALDFTTTSENLTSKPESFRGMYANYMFELIKVSSDIVPNIIKLLSDFQIVVAMFINETNDNKIGHIYGIENFKKAEKNLAAWTTDISKFFPSNTGNSKTRFRDIFHTYDDFKKIFIMIEDMDKIVNHKTTIAVAKDVDNIKDLIDTLIEMTSKGSVVLNNEDHKKDLVYATYVSGKYVEFLSYLFTNILTFYGVYKNNCEDLIKI